MVLVVGSRQRAFQENEMRKIPVLVFAAALSGSVVPAAAVDESRFLLRNTADLGALCSATAEEPRALEAMHMCHGYLVGLHHFHEAMSFAKGAAPIYCLGQESPPTRQDAAADFVAWIDENPDAVDLPAVEGAVRWAATRFPCD